MSDRQSIAELVESFGINPVTVSLYGASREGYVRLVPWVEGVVVPQPLDDELTPWPPGFDKVIEENASLFDAWFPAS